jgi:GntR family transcriptional regulator
MTGLHMDTLSKNASVPLYLQVKNVIEAEIRDEKYGIDQRLPSERELCERFGVSRMTARQAIKELERDGLVFSRVGKGTFVSDPKIDQQLGNLTGFSQDISTRGARPTSVVLSAKIIQADEYLATILKIMQGADVVELSRLRLSNDLPLCIEVAHIPHYLCLNILKRDFARESLYRVFERDYGYRLVRAEQTMEASLANPRELELLKMTPPASVLRIERLTYNQQDILLEYVTSAYRGDLYKFHLTLQ